MEVNGHNSTQHFDTLASFDALVARGFSEEQARGMLDVFQKQSAAAEVATKMDVERVRADLKRDIADAKVWLSGMVFAAVGLFAAFMAFLRFFVAP